MEKLAAQATSEAAKAKARALLPQTDVEDVKRLQQETSAACMLLGLQPVLCRSKGCVCRAGQGAARRYAEHAGIAGYCSASAVRPPGKGLPRRRKRSGHCARYHVPRPSWGTLSGRQDHRAIPEENEIADNASAELADIRRHMHAAGARSRQILQKIISSPTYSKALQESIITQRDGRFVVPVKAECRSEVPDWFTTCRLRAPRCLSNRWVWCRPTMNSRSWKPKRKKRSSGFCFCFPKRRQPCRKIFYGTTTCWCSWI